MDTQELQAFVAVHDTGGFSSAADRLHLTQPAISKRIASLETRLAQRLFDRIGRRVSLTEGGRALLPYARDALRALDNGRAALTRLGDTVSGRLAIGTSHHIGLHRLPPVLGAYTHDFPAVDLDIRFMDSEIACDAVRAGELELGIVTLPNTAAPQLILEPIWDDPMSLVVGRRHPWADRQRLDITELAERPAVLPDEATYTHVIVREALARHGITPPLRLATNYLETLKMLVAIGLGWSLLPDAMLDEQLVRIPVDGLTLRRELGIVRHRDRSVSAAADRLCRRLRAAG